MALVGLYDPAFSLERWFGDEQKLGTWFDAQLTDDNSVTPPVVTLMAMERQAFRRVFSRVFGRVN